MHDEREGGFASQANKASSIACKHSLACILGLASFWHHLAPAATIEIPWTVDLAVSPPTYESVDVISGGFKWDPPLLSAGGVNTGLRLRTSSDHQYSIHLPFTISITAPDEARAGQSVWVKSKVGFAGQPSFRVSSSLSFATDFFLNANNVPFAGDYKIDERLPNNLSLAGGSLTFGGASTYTAETSDANPRRVGTPWRNDPFGQPLEVAGTMRFEGYEFVTTEQVDAWEASIDLLDVAKRIPPAAAVATAADLVMDIPLSLGIDIEERSALDVAFLTAFYSEDGISYDNLLLNNPISDTSFTGGDLLTIPSALNVGDVYSLQFTALGTAFNTVYDLLFQPNFELAVDVEGFAPWTIIDADIGDGWTVDREISSYQYVQFLTEYLTGPEFLSKRLDFRIVADSQDDVTTTRDSAAEDAIVNDLIADQIATGSDETRFTIPGNTPNGAEGIQELLVPEPNSALLILLILVPTVVNNRTIYGLCQRVLLRRCVLRSRTWES